jgi:hypothetical protein
MRPNYNRQFPRNCLVAKIAKKPFFIAPHFTSITPVQSRYSMFIGSALLVGLFLSFFAVPAAAANVCRPYRRTNAYAICVAYCTTNQCATTSNNSRQCRVLRRQFIRRTGAARLPCDLTAKPTAKPAAKPTARPSSKPSFRPSASPTFLSTTDVPSISPTFLSSSHFPTTSPAAKYYPTGTSLSPTGPF